MPKSKSIQDIKTNLLNPALTSLYYVTVSKPYGKPDSKSNKVDEFFQKNLRNSINQEKLNLMCCEATLPGSNLATLELTNDRTGVTERHAYRRVYDDRIDLTFYVDTQDYLPILYFETWIKYISQESIAPDATKGTTRNANYFYSFQYPNSYMDPQGLTVTKFEKSSLGGVKGKAGGTLKYTFIRSFPVSINSMPVSYDSSSLLKCTVSMSYIRYIVEHVKISTDPPRDSASDSSTATEGSVDNPFNAARITAQDQAAFNSAPEYFLNPQFGIAALAEGSNSDVTSQLRAAELENSLGSSDASRAFVESYIKKSGRQVGRIGP